MTLVTETVPETERVERERTQIDYETVTTEVEKVKCDCCEQKWSKDGRVETREIVVNPTASVTLEERIGGDSNAYQSEQSCIEEQLNEYVEGFMVEVPNPEHNASDMLHRNEQDGKPVNRTLVEARQYRKDSMDMGFGSIDRYLRSMGFRIEVPVQGATKHLCEYCYGAIFNA